MFKRKAVIVATLLTFSWSATAADLEVLFVGLPQAGPSVALTQAYAQGLKTPHKFTPVKDCKSSLDVVANSDNVVYLIGNTSTLGALRSGQECVPKLIPDDIIFTANNYFHFCHLPDSKKDLFKDRQTIAAASVVPVSGFAKSLNKENNTKLVPLSMLSSNEVALSVINKDIDWGIIITSVATPLITSGQLSCPYSTNPKEPNYIAKNLRMDYSNLSQLWILSAKTKDPALKQAAKSAVRSAEFNKFLEAGKFSDVKTENFTNKDIENFNKLIDQGMAIYDIK